MDVAIALENGHQNVLRTIAGLPESEWQQAGVCGVWSVKDIIAHLASFEHLLVEILTTFSGESQTPCMDLMRADSLRFNQIQVDLRKDNSRDEVLGEYLETI